LDFAPKCKEGVESLCGIKHKSLLHFLSFVKLPAALEQKQRSCQPVSRRLLAQPESMQCQLLEEWECAQVHLL